MNYSKQPEELLRIIIRGAGVPYEKFNDPVVKKAGHRYSDQYGTESWDNLCNLHKSDLVYLCHFLLPQFVDKPTTTKEDIKITKDKPLIRNLQTFRNTDRTIALDRKWLKEGSILEVKDNKNKIRNLIIKSQAYEGVGGDFYYYYDVAVIKDGSPEEFYLEPGSYITYE